MSEDKEYTPSPYPISVGSEALVAWRVRHKNDGPHMWEYYLLPREKMLRDDLIYQDLTLRQLLDFLNDDRHANAQERAPEPHAPSYLMEAFRDAWKMANEAGVEDDWEDAFRFWAPPYAVNTAQQSAEACYLECEHMDSYGIIDTIAKYIRAAREDSSDESPPPMKRLEVDTPSKP